MQKEIQMVHVMFLAIETGGIVTTLLAFFFSTMHMALAELHAYSPPFNQKEI